MLLDVRGVLFDVLVFAAHCVLLGGFVYVMCDVRCRLLVVHCVLFVVYRVLVIVCSLLVVAV